MRFLTTSFLTLGLLCSASSAAHSIAALACSEPSEPTVTPSTKAERRLTSSCTRYSVPHCRGMIPTGQCAWAGTAVDTEPSSRPMNPPRPRDPRTSSWASLLRSTSTPEGSPAWTVERTSTSSSATRRRASATRSSTARFMAASSNAA